MTIKWKIISAMIVIIWPSILAERIDCGNTDDYLDRSLEHFLANCKPKFCQCLSGVEESCASYPDVTEMFALNLMMEANGTSTSFECPNFDIWQTIHLTLVEPDLDYIRVLLQPKPEHMTQIYFRYYTQSGEFKFLNDKNPKTMKLFEKLETRALLELLVKSFSNESSDWLSSSLVVSSTTDPYFSTTVFGPLGGRDSLQNEYKLLIDTHPNNNFTFGPINLIFNTIDVGFDYTFQHNPSPFAIHIRPSLNFCMGRKLDENTGLARWTAKGCRIVIGQSRAAFPDLRHGLNKDYRCECDFKSISFLDIDDIPHFEHNYEFGIDIPCDDICDRNWILTLFAYGFMIAAITMLSLPFWYVFYYKS